MKASDFVKKIGAIACDAQVAEKIAAVYGKPMPEDVTKALSYNAQGEFFDSDDICRLMSVDEVANASKELGVDFVVVKSDAAEVSYPHDPERTVRDNALAKGAAVGGARVLSADTIVWFDGKIYGKPKDLDQAKEYLRELSGNVHTVFTGVAYDGQVKVVRSDVKFRRLDAAAIDAYVARVKPTDRAGAYDIDESGDLIVESYTGSYENIMGLPLEPLREWHVIR